MFRVLALVLLVPALSFSSGFETLRCENSNFERDAWPVLVRDNPSLHQFLRDIAVQSGQLGQGDDYAKLLDLVNCKIKYGVDENGEPDDSLREAILFHQWRHTDGKTAQQGMRILFRTQYEPVGEGFRVTRALYGRTECLGPYACELLNVLDKQPTVLNPLARVAMLKNLPRGFASFVYRPLHCYLNEPVRTIYPTKPPT